MNCLPLDIALVDIEAYHGMLAIPAFARWTLTGEFMRYANARCTITRAQDATQYRLFGKLHRFGFPAVEWSNGDKQWYMNDKLHRDDGPAIERVNVSKNGTSRVKNIVKTGRRSSGRTVRNNGIVTINYIVRSGLRSNTLTVGNYGI